MATVQSSRSVETSYTVMSKRQRSDKGVEFVKYHL